MTFQSRPASLAVFYDGWAKQEGRILEVIRPLTAEQLQLRGAPDHWSIWQLAANMVGGRAYWFHDISWKATQRSAPCFASPVRP